MRLVSRPPYGGYGIKRVIDDFGLFDGEMSMKMVNAYFGDSTVNKLVENLERES